MLPWICVASGALTTCVGLNHLFVAIPVMLITLGICAISLIFVLVVAGKVTRSESECPFSLAPGLSLILLSPIPYTLLVFILMGIYRG